jgi:hypothetical protein
MRNLRDPAICCREKYQEFEDIHDSVSLYFIVEGGKAIRYRPKYWEFCKIDDNCSLFFLA